MSWYFNLAFFIGLLFIRLLAGGRTAPAPPQPTPTVTGKLSGDRLTSTTSAAAMPLSDATPPPQEPLNQRRMTVAMVVLTLAAHVAAAESYGFSVVSSLRRAADVLLGRSLPAVPEPWASALSFAFLSATCWLLKPILARIVCERWLGLPERSTMTVRRWTDGVHVVLTPLVVLAIVFGSETSDFELMPMLALSWGAFVVTVIAFMAVDVFWQRTIDPEGWERQKAEREAARAIERFGLPCGCSTQKEASGEPGLVSASSA